jgi:hypothetical protein
MPDRAEVMRSLYGAWRLACLDQEGMRFFNLTVEGFWRSFFAALLVAPGYAVLVGDQLSQQPPAASLGWLILVQTAAYLVGWAAFPLAALAITAWLRLSQHYVALIVAVNWAVVLQVAVFLAAILLARALPPGLGDLILMAVMLAAIAYQWFITRTALQTSGSIALMLVLFDLVLNIMINLAADRLTGA